MAVSPQTLLFVLRVQDEASRALQGAGLAVASMGFAFGAAGAAAVKASIDFNRTLTQMQTLASVSANEIDGVSEALRTMAIETGKAPQDLANAMYYVSSSGFQTKEALDVVKASAQGAAVGLGDTKTVADAVTSAMNAYGHSNLSASDAVGTLIEAVKMGKGEADQIASAIGKTINVAAQLGVTFKDVTGATAAMTTTGLTAAQSVTAIRQTLMAIYAPTVQARRVLKQLGADYHDLQKVFREQGFLVGIERLREVAGSGVNLRMILGDKEAVNAVLGLLNQNLEHTKQIMDQVNAAGEKTLRQTFAEAAKSNAFQWAQGVALIKVALLDLGDVVMPIIIKAIHGLIEAFYALKGLIDTVTQAWHNHRLAMEALIGAITALLVIRVLPGLFINLAAAIAISTVRLVGMTTAIEAFSVAKVASSFGALATSIGLVARAAVAAVPGILAFTLALVTNPVFLMIAALAAAGVALYEFANTMFDTSQGVVSGWEIIEATWAGAGAFFGEIGSEIMTALAPVGAWISDLWQQVVDWTREHWDAIAAAVQAGVMAVLAAIPLLGPVVKMVVDHWDQIEDLTTRAWDGIVNTVKQHIFEILSAVPLVGMAIAAAYAAAQGAPGQAASGAFNRSIQQSAAAHPAQVPGARSVRLRLGPAAQEELQGQSVGGFTPPSIPNVPDYMGTGGGRHGARKSQAETDAEKEAKAVQRVVEALKVQASAYTETADQHEYLDAIRRAGLNSLTIEQDTLEKGLDITDKEAAGSARLNHIREIARGVLQKLTAEHSNWLEQMSIDTDMQPRLAAAHAMSAKQAYIDTAVINAQTEALKNHKKFTDADAQAVRDRANAEFASSVAMKAVDDARDWNKTVNGLLDQAQAFTMSDREGKIWLAGQEARRQAIAAGSTDIEGYVARAQVLEAMQYDIANHQMSATEGVIKFMDDMRTHAITTGTIVYNALKSVYDALGSALWNFVSNQKVGWRQLAFDVANSIGKMITQMLVMKAVMASLKFLGFATGGTLGGGTVPGMNALGNTFGTATKFAKGQSFTNTVVSALTAFLYNENGRKKLGVMGEAGPEAIMPLLKNGQAMAVAAYAADGTRRALELTRGPDGALGVKWPERFAYGGVFGNRGMRGMGSGGGGSGGVYFNFGDVNLTLNPTGDPQYDSQHLSKAKRMVQGVIDERIGVAVRQMEKQGGRFNVFGMKRNH
jgi:TP901 family phage tail tape measure protein/lambda family phage tail tape measure protein